MNGDSRFFVDTNVLLYSIDQAEAAKRRRARQWLKALWESGRGNLSWQVLHEFYVNAVKKLQVPPDRARQVVEIYVPWTPVEMTFGLVQRALHWADQAQVGYWDALIVAAAERAGCAGLLTEDLQAGRGFGQVTVVNPFEHDPSDLGFPSETAP